MLRARTLVIAIAACGVDTDPPPTWHDDVAPILAARCLGCHVEGGAAPFALTEYDAVRANAARMMNAIDTGQMPPFDARAEPACTPRHGFFEDPRVTRHERTVLRRWIDDGFLLGAPAPVPAPPSTELARVTKRIAPAEGFVASGDRDQFACFVLDPELAESSWLTGLQVRPEIAAVVHHVTIVAVDPGAELDALIARHGIGRPFDCSESPPSFGIHVWTPGQQPMQLPPGVAWPLAAGAMMITGLHYHPQASPSLPDHTALELQLSTEKPRASYGVIVLGGAVAAPELLPGPGDRDGPEFRIPAGATDHVERMRFTITGIDASILMMGPHMHLAGAHISASIERRTGDTECLQNGSWNFDWQRTYTFDAPLDRLPTLRDGDVLDLTCRYDNSRRNPFVQRMMVERNLGAPIDLVPGPETFQEMCQETIGVVSVLD